MANTDVWYFVCDGDPQVGAESFTDGTPKIRSEKTDIDKKLLEIHEIFPIDMVICAGDLTNSGVDDKSTLCCSMRKIKDEFHEYLDQYEHPIEMAGFELKICPGNHDTYVPWPHVYKPVFDHVIQKHGATSDAFEWKNSGCYKFLHRNILFICMGVYPYNLTWLLKNLPNPKTPIVFFYHYHTIHSDPYGNWWTLKEKNAFYNLIKNYNVILIVNGHWHTSGMGIWNGIPVVRGAGAKLVLITIDGITLDDIKLM